MKLDSGADSHHSPPAQEPTRYNDSGADYHHSPPAQEPTRYNGNHLEAEKLKTTCEDRKEGNHSFVSLAKCLNHERAFWLSQHEDRSGIHGTVDMLDSFSGRQNDNGHMVDPISALHIKSEVLKKERDSTKNLVTGIGEQKMIICFQKDISEHVKDICIDEGKHSLKNFMLQSDEVGHMKVLTVHHSASNESSKTTNEMPAFDVLKSLVQNQQPSSDVESKGIFTNGGKFEKTNAIDNLFCEKVIANDVVPWQEFDRRQSSVGFSMFGCNYDQSQSAINVERLDNICDEKLIAKNFVSEQVPDGKKIQVDLSSVDCIYDKSQSAYDDSRPQYIGNTSCQEQAKKGVSEEINTIFSATTASIEQNKNKNVTGVVTKNEVGNDIMTSDSNADIPRAIVGKENSGDGQLPLSRQAITGSGLGDASIDGRTSSSRKSYVLYGDSELSFIGPASSGWITYSGQITYSGSISLRSDSSARSFAFPILQSEWNSSPVKMAKADRKHFRKHRGWRMGLLCCRF